MPKRKLQDRFEVFADGDWASLLASSMERASQAAQASSRRSRRQDTDNLESRAARAEALVQMGELSAARQALEGAAVALGARDTLNALQDPERRPPVLRDPFPPDILHAAPVEQFSLDFDVFTRNIRSARGGAAGGPSGMTAEHLRFILESPSETTAKKNSSGQHKTWREQKSPKTSSCCSVWGVSLHSRNQAVASGASCVGT